MPISIPEYFRRYVNSKVDLESTPKICCPFHTEELPSFSYSKARGVWRCFGACKAGGDVIELHRKNYHLRTRKEAEDSLYHLLGITKPNPLNRVYMPHTEAFDEEHKVLALAVTKANTIEDWIELDYIMSQSYNRTKELDKFLDERK